MQEILFTLILSLLPPDRVPRAQGEPLEEWQDRMSDIASDIAHVVRTREPLFSGPEARERTAAALLAVAVAESGLDHRVDLGPCRPGTCDGGRAACVMQVLTWTDGRDIPRLGHVTREQLFADRRLCLTAGLELMRSSLAACRHLPPSHQLAAYTSGSCRRGLRGAQARWRTAGQLWARWRGMAEGDS